MSDRRLEALLLLKQPPAVADQPVSDMVMAVADGSRAGAIDNHAGDVGFAHLRIGRENFDGAAIPVPRVKIHPCIISRRIPAQDIFDLAGPVKKIFP